MGNEDKTKTDIAIVDGMSHKRQNTLKTLIDVTASPNTAPHHELKKSLSNARKFSVGDLTAVQEDESDQYDPEIFKYLSELVGNDQSAVPLTPSTRSVMKDLFVDAMNDDEISLNMPEFNSSANSNSADSYSGYHHGAQYSHSDVSQLSDTNNNDNKQNDEDENVIESMEQGTTLLKYGKYGKPKYKMFHLSADHKYLEWYSQKKSSQETRIRIKDIKKISIGSDSKVVQKTKKKDLHETSFTIFYGKPKDSEKMWKNLTVTAKNDKEAFVWAQGLKILSDASKQGRHLRTLSTSQMGPSPQNESNATPKKPGHQKQESVIISIDKLQKQSVLNLFSKSSQSTATSLLKQHNKHKQQLQKCVDFVMTKTNYRAISNAGQFDKIKTKLEDLDNRLRIVKAKLTKSDVATSELSAVKADLYSCAADLDALKQKLTAIVRRPQKL